MSDRHATPVDPASALRRGDRIYGGHVLLAGSMAFWRALAATPALAASQGGTFESSPVGRALAVATLFGSVVVLVVLARLSFAQWRDPRTSALLVLFAASIAWRGPIDAFDLAYLALVAVLATAWFATRRTRVVRA